MQSSPAPQWRSFLRALAAELDASVEPARRDAMLRGIGRRMAGMLPLADATSLETLELEINDALGSIGWGQVAFDLQEDDHCLLLTHAGLPRVGTGGDPPGAWLAPALEGLYEGWMAQQPGSEPSLTARLQGSAGAGTVVLRYGRE